MEYELLTAEKLIMARGRSVQADPPITAIPVRFASGVERLFYMQLLTEGREPVQNARGRWKRIDGQFVDPDTQPPDTEYEMETVEYDPMDQVRENIEAYLDRCNNQPVGEIINPQKGEAWQPLDSDNEGQRLREVKRSIRQQFRKRERQERRRERRRRGE